MFRITPAVTGTIAPNKSQVNMRFLRIAVHWLVVRYLFSHNQAHFATDGLSQSTL